jgi:hypothetical protein
LVTVVAGAALTTSTLSESEADTGPLPAVPDAVAVLLIAAEAGTACAAMRMAARAVDPQSLNRDCGLGPIRADGRGRSMKSISILRRELQNAFLGFDGLG